MTTPEHLRDLADRNDAEAEAWRQFSKTSGRIALHDENATALRTAADQLESVEREAREWIAAPADENAPARVVGEVFLAILTADTAPQDGDDD